MEANGITHDSSLGAGRRDKREVGDKSMEDLSKYAHSPAHMAVARRDHASLRRIVSALPRLAKAGEVNTEAESLAAELKADEVSSVIDRRDVPGRETPLHLAVRLRDPVSAEILMAAGADWSLQNEHGWSALQEAVCTREEAIAMIIARHYQPLAWAKWCRRLPRIVASASRIRDFYMEISFHFESSVIPFIGRIAPSDTYRIWKRGSNLRADMTLAGFDGLRIQRSDQTFLFLGEGYVAEEGNLTLPPGSLIALSHKEKEITNALEGAGTQPTEAEVAHEVSLMSQTNMYRPGIDVTQAELVPHLNWRRQEKTEMVGNWKAKVYDMLHVMVSVKSRRVPADQQKSASELLKEDSGDNKKGKDKTIKKKKKKGASTEPKNESEYKKGLRPVLWLTPDFPLKTDELLPLLDILANKVKAIRRLRELLTTKLPLGTFPVKVAIPIVPTIRVLVTFTKFEELQPVEEFSTPLSSPAHFHDAKSKESEGSSSWISWMKGSRGGQSSDSDSHRYKDEVDPFSIPADYKWVDANEKKRRMKAKKAKSKKHKKQTVAKGGDGVNQDVEEE
uniref:Ankyrin repeat domain-containing protein 13B n=1 Tax=Cajanus cajan TaxID=3821 RepID=A0A151RJH3_CAJCA|nr:Ankyrin repeat domain-containing protein 13B [Cajanus cajan]